MQEWQEHIEKRLGRLEQQTEPIKVVLEQKPTEAESVLLQTIMTMVGTQATDIGTLKNEMQGARADILAIKATQSDHGELIKTTQNDITEMKQDIASIKSTQEQILKLLQQKGD